jgi:hypothetical protein
MMSIYFLPKKRLLIHYIYLPGIDHYLSEEEMR